MCPIAVIFGFDKYYIKIRMLYVYVPSFSLKQDILFY